MARKAKSPKPNQTPKAVLKLPDLDQAKSAVLNSPSSADAQRGYRHAIDGFIEWYCSEPRLFLNRSVVLRYRIHWESRNLALGTVSTCASAACGVWRTQPPIAAFSALTSRRASAAGKASRSPECARETG